jgi:hypothetical protein
MTIATRNTFRSSRSGGLVLAFACLAEAALTPGVRAQTNAAVPPSNRWLLIVETSRYTRSSGNEVPRLAAMIVASGMKGQVRSGDTLGMWTFNDALYTGKFPLQTLAPEVNRRIAQRVFDFLNEQEFEKKGRLDKILPEVHQIIKESDYLTVILLSSGTKEISGTPFDAEINTAYETLQKERKKTKLPIVTVLRAQQGRITNYTVSLPIRSLEIPPLPPELLVTNVVESKPAPRPKPVVPPLILRGRQSEPETEPPP